MPNSVTNPRWQVTGQPFGGGGGGNVYLCFGKTLVQATIEFMRTSMHLTATDAARETASMKLLETLHHAIAFGKNGIAALKIPRSLDDPRVAQRFTQEIAAMRSVAHPALIKLLDHDEQQSPAWFVMEYHPEGDLSKKVATYSAQPLRSLLAIRPVVAGVAELHRGGFVHRDIKPKNIFVAKAGELILGDFGIVFPLEGGDPRLTVAGEEILSRDWIPDWIRYNETPPQYKVDVFMLAKVIYFMVSGGRKVLASQLNRPENDLTRQFPNTPGVADVYSFLKDYITTDEENCKAEHAEEMLKQLDRVIEVLKGNYHAQLIFNFYSSHSMTHIQIGSSHQPLTQYPQLRGLRVFLPRPCDEFRAFARVIPPGLPADTHVSFQIDNHCSNSIIIRGPGAEPGIWSDEITLKLDSPLSRGVHTLDVIPVSSVQAGALTAFTLYAE